MLDHLNPAARAAVMPVLQRWEKFTASIWQRFQDVVAEAEPGIDQVVAMDPTNASAISGAFTVTESRLRGLTDKVQEAEEKVSETWSEATDDLDVSDVEQAILRRLESQIVNQSRDLQRQVERQGEMFLIKKNADWSRALYPLAQQEMAEPRQCSNCGAPIEVAVKHMASNVTCAHCNGVSSVVMGMATGLYYQGAGVHALAREAAKDAWLNEQQAETWFNALRHPTAADRQRYLDAARNYWMTYHQAFQHWHPGFSGTVEQASEDKLRHYTAWDMQSERTQLEAFGEIIRLAAARDPAGLAKCVAHYGVDAADMVVAIHERGDRDGTMMALEIEYKMDDVDDPKSEWMNERLAELDADLANR